MNKFADVNNMLKLYFDGLYYSDPKKLQLVFHPLAIYASADETPLLYRTMSDYFEVVSKRESPASRQEVRTDVVEQIQFAGENTAFARVRCSIGTRDFVDFLTLVRTETTWQIMAKVFQITEHQQ